MEHGSPQDTARGFGELDGNELLRGAQLRPPHDVRVPRVGNAVRIDRQPAVDHDRDFDVRARSDASPKRAGNEEIAQAPDVFIRQARDPIDRRLKTLVRQERRVPYAPRRRHEVVSGLREESTEDFSEIDRTAGHSGEATRHRCSATSGGRLSPRRSLPCVSPSPKRPAYSIWPRPETVRTYVQPGRTCHSSPTDPSGSTHG